MFEVPDEVPQTADREDEDEKQERVEEKKTLYELDNLYRTEEKRLKK